MRVGGGNALLQLYCRYNARCGEAAGEERDVGLFVDVDLLQVLVEGICEAGVDKLGLRVIGDAFLVDLPLEVFERQGVVEDDAIVDDRGEDDVVTLLDGRGGAEARYEESGGGGGEIHHGLYEL